MSLYCLSNKYSNLSTSLFHHFQNVYIIIIIELKNQTVHILKSSLRNNNLSHKLRMKIENVYNFNKYGREIKNIKI